MAAVFPSMNEVSQISFQGSEVKRFQVRVDRLLSSLSLGEETTAMLPSAGHMPVYKTYSRA